MVVFVIASRSKQSPASRGCDHAHRSKGKRSTEDAAAASAGRRCPARSIGTVVHGTVYLTPVGIYIYAPRCSASTRRRATRTRREKDIASSFLLLTALFATTYISFAAGSLLKDTDGPDARHARRGGASRAAARWCSASGPTLHDARSNGGAGCRSDGIADPAMPRPSRGGICTCMAAQLLRATAEEAAPSCTIRSWATA